MLFEQHERKIEYQSGGINGYYSSLSNWHIYYIPISFLKAKVPVMDISPYWGQALNEKTVKEKKKEWSKSFWGGRKLDFKKGAGHRW